MLKTIHLRLYFRYNVRCFSCNSLSNPCNSLSSFSQNNERNYSKLSKTNSLLLKNTTLSSFKCLNNSRDYSLNSSVDSVLRNQTGFFRSISESAPVEYVQNFLVSFHDSTGLPWWATVICTAILLRTFITLPLSVYQHYILAKLENLKLELPDVTDRIKRDIAQAMRKHDYSERTVQLAYLRSVKTEWNKMVIRENCHPFKAVLVVLFQIPLWFSLSVSLRNLACMLPIGNLFAEVHFDELSREGVLWITNLTTADSTFMFPITFAALNLLIIELQLLSRVQVPTKLRTFVTNTLKVITILFIPVTANMPACMVLYWTTSSVFGVAQNLILLSPKVRRFFKIPVTPSELEQPYTQVYLGLLHKMRIGGIHRS